MGSQSRNFTILLNDIVGFTETTANMKRASMMQMLKTHDELIRPILDSFHGNIVKTMGDAFLSTFDSPTDAVLCAVKIQEVLRNHNEALPDQEQIHVRCSLHAGEVQVAENGDIFGEAVNITARLETATPGDAIYMTENVYLQVNRNEIPETKREKKYRFKGISHEIQVYKVCQTDDETVPSDKNTSTSKIAIYAAAAILIIGIFATIVWAWRMHSTGQTASETDTIIGTAGRSTHTNPADIRESKPQDDDYKPRTFHVSSENKAQTTDEPDIEDSIIESMSTPGTRVSSTPSPEPDDFKSVLEETVTP